MPVAQNIKPMMLPILSNKPDALCKPKPMELPLPPPGTKIAVGLSKEKVQELFEAKFGKDKQSRTRKQWRALVDQYGYETVARTDKMTVKEVKAKCKNKCQTFLT